ncbi:MAG: nucleotide-binding protein [Beijerinckiaceae bacterium]|jgi:predicted nucleotide-binding protein
MSQSNQPSLTRPRLEISKALDERVALGKELRASAASPGKYSDPFMTRCKKWRDYNEEFLQRVFTNVSIARKYHRVAFAAEIGMKTPTPIDQHHKYVDAQIAELESVLNRLELYPEAASQPSSLDEDARSLSNKIFVVHGHDIAAKEAVARFLGKVELDAIILNEQPDRGLTIIEKFESHAAQVAFAVVLLTPDDLGAQAAAQSQNARARQNVIFELGYFVGKLGRGRVCLLCKGDVEIPSDLYGVIYTDMDAADGWKLKLAKELKAAGLVFDASKIFE